MPTPLEFRALLPDMAGGRDSVLATARERLQTTHKLTKAGDASNIPLPKVEKHVTDVIVEALRTRLFEPLSELLANHLQSVQDEYELMEGEAPEEPAAAKEWLHGLWTAHEEALTGEVRYTAGGEAALQALVWSEDFSSIELTQLMLSKIGDVKRAFASMNISPGDIAGLVEVARGAPPAEAPEDGFGLADIADLVRARLAEGADLFELDEAVRTMLSTTDTESFDIAVALLTDDERIAGELFNFTEVRPVDPEADDLDAKAILEVASAVEAEPEAPPAPPAASRTVGKGRSPSENKAFVEVVTRKAGRPRGGSEPVPDERSEAAQEILMAMCEFSGCTEVALAAALGVSRATMNNYRHGKALLQPTTAQAAALGKLLAKYLNGLQNAQETFAQTFGV